MKSQPRVFFLFLSFLIYFNYAIHLIPSRQLNENAAYKLLVCKSINNNKLFLTLEPLDKSKEYRCKNVSNKKIKEYLNISPSKLKEYYKHKRLHSKRVHKLEIRNSLLYINILSKYLDNYICYSLYKEFKKNKCTKFQNYCKKIFKKNNFQVYSTVDMINIFKKLSKTISNQRLLRKFKNTVLILNLNNKDLEWAHYIFDNINKKFKIFNDFDVVLFKTKGRMYLFKFSSKYYRIQLSNLKLNKNSFKKKKNEKMVKYLKKYRRLRNKIRDSHTNSREFIIRSKLAKLKNNIQVCKAYEKVYNHFLSMDDRKYRLLYYFDPLIDIQFGNKHIRVHYLNRLITFKFSHRKRNNLLKRLNTKKTSNTFTSFVNGFMKKPDLKKEKKINKKWKIKRVENNHKKKTSNLKLKKEFKSKIFLTKQKNETLTTKFPKEKKKLKENKKWNKKSQNHKLLKKDASLNNFYGKDKTDKTLSKNTTKAMKITNYKLKKNQTIKDKKNDKLSKFPSNEKGSHKLNYKDIPNKKGLEGNKKFKILQENKELHIMNKKNNSENKRIKIKEKIKTFTNKKSISKFDNKDNSKKKGNMPEFNYPALKNKTINSKDKQNQIFNDNYLKNIFLETNYIKSTNKDKSDIALTSKYNDNDLYSAERIIYKKKTYFDREDFLDSLLNKKVSPKQKTKIANLADKKFIKLYQDPQDYYEKRFSQKDDISKSFSDADLQD